MPPSSREVLRTTLLAFGLVAVALIALVGPGAAVGARLFLAHDIGGSDLWHMYYPFWRQAAESVAAGELPLWSSKLGTGFPLLAEGQVGALYPPNLLLRAALPLPAAFNAAILLHMALAGAFTAAFARRIGVSRGGSVFAALVFGLGGFFVLHVRHPNMTASAAWFPLILLLVESWIRSRRPILPVLLALAVAMSFLAGHPQMAYYNLIVAAGWAAFRLFVPGRSRRAAKGPELLWLGAGVLFGAAGGALLAAPQLVPTFELMQHGGRRGGISLTEASRSRIGLRHLLLWVDPEAFGDPGDLRLTSAVDPESGEELLDPESGRPLPYLVGYESGEERDLYWAVTAYVGLLPLLFAALALLLRGATGPPRSPLVLLVVVTLVLAAGTAGKLFTLLYYLLPGFDLFRFPSRFLVYTAFGIAVLGGAGLSEVLRRLDRRFLPTRPVVVPATLALVLVFAFLDLDHAFSDQLPTVDGGRWTEPPEIARRILAEEEGRTPPARVLAVDPERKVFTNAYSRARGWKGDLTPYEPMRTALHPNLTLLYGLDGFIMHSPSSIRWADEGSYLVFPRSDPGRIPPVQVNGRVASLFNVRWIVDPFDVLADVLPSVAEYEGDAWLTLDDRGEFGAEPYSIHLRENPGAMPRAFLVAGHRLVPAEGPPKGGLSLAQRALVDIGFDPRIDVLLASEDATTLGRHEGGTEPLDAPVRFLAYEDRYVRIAVEAPRECWLFLSDTYYPGWTAEVDGVETPVRRANVFGRAVRVPAGARIVELRYRPRSFAIGLVAALVGAFLLAAWSLFLREKSE